MVDFDLKKSERDKLFTYIWKKAETYYQDTRSIKVTPRLNQREIIEFIHQVDFSGDHTPEKVVDQVFEGLQEYSVHTPHPMYYGLFNPRSNFPSIMADFITAIFNCQMAAWSHSPFAAEVENHLIQEMGKKFGYHENSIDGVFASGGAEANLTAVQCAINHRFDTFATDGLIGIKKRPVLYCSSEAHHSVVKAARSIGLGSQSVKEIAVSQNLSMDVPSLELQIEKDLKEGLAPFMVIGTAGTTGVGAIDDLPKIAAVARQNQLWFHVDAAYGGASILSNELRLVLRGIELSDSITFDVHKWLSVPMATSMFLTSNKEILHKTYRITTEYMPKEARDMEIVDPFTHSVQWSRRFIGLKLYLSLLFFGWKGYEEVINHQTKMGDLLRDLLNQHNWSIKNDTRLPIVCFTDNRFESDQVFTTTLCNNIIASGKAWLSVYPINKMNTLRVCITNYATLQEDILLLVKILNEYRAQYEADDK